MPEIIAALQFEAAIGEYFNITSNFHYSPGELTNRSGFRIFEMHMFWFCNISPWWESALNKSMRMRYLQNSSVGLCWVVLGCVGLWPLISVDSAQVSEIR